MDLSNVILPAAVSAVVSAIVSYLLGPRMAVRQEAARGDAHVRTSLRGDLREIVQLLEYEEMNREDLINGMDVPPDRFLKSRNLDEPFWRLIRTAEDPRLDQRIREEFYEQLRRIIPVRFDILRKLPQAPKPKDYDLLQPLDSLIDRFAVRALENFMQGQKYEDEVDILDTSPDDKDALGKLRELKEKLRKIERLLEKKGALGKLADRIGGVLNRFARSYSTGRAPSPSTGDSSSPRCW